MCSKISRHWLCLMSVVAFVENVVTDGSVEPAEARKVRTETREEHVASRKLKEAPAPVKSKNLKGNRFRENVSIDQIRFSKISVQSSKFQSRLPLVRSDFPLKRGTVSWLRESNAVSVVTQEDIFPRTDDSIVSASEVLEPAGIIKGPTYPDDPEFWDEFDFVTRTQIARQECGKDLLASEVWDVPNSWIGFNLNQAAEAVHDEFPGLWQQEFLEAMFGQGLKVDPDIIPARSKVEFLLGPVMLAEMNTWAIGCVGTYSFVSKWTYGRPRPEEVGYKIKQGEIGREDGVHQSIIDNVMQLKNFKKMEQYTAYEEGCPRHPSWPAMHSAASTLSFWLSVVCDLTKEQQEEAKRVDYAVSFARTIAGVHYMTDNLDGLNLGQEVLAQELAPYLEGTYGSDQKKVREKIKKMRFDWNDYKQAKDASVPSCRRVDEKKKKI